MTQAANPEVLPPPPGKKNPWVVAVVAIVAVCCCCFGAAGLLFAFWDSIAAELGLLV